MQQPVRVCRDDIDTILDDVEAERAKLRATLGRHGLAHLADGVDWARIKGDLEYLYDTTAAAWGVADEFHDVALGQAKAFSGDAVVQALTDATRLNPHGFFVYLLFGEDEGAPLYVGQSCNVFARLGTHTTTRRATVKTVQLIRCATRDRMDRLEVDLIRHYRPQWNTVHVPKAAS